MIFVVIYCLNLVCLRPKFLQTPFFFFFGLFCVLLLGICLLVGKEWAGCGPFLSKMSASGSIANGEPACRADSKGGSLAENLPVSL